VTVTLGFIGTGHLASFFVEGLNRVKADYAVTVSARNTGHSAELQRKFGVMVSADNQQIVDSCNLVVVCVLPQQARSTLAPLRFRAGQTVLSVMAGVRLATIRDLTSPAACAVSMMPGLANAHNIGPSALCPPEPASQALLAKLGPVHAYDDEVRFTAASTMGAFSGMSVLMMRDAVRWFSANGLSPADARRLVAETLRGNATMLLESPLDLDHVARGVVTPGGITEQGRKVLDAGGSWATALDGVFARISRGT
jgi:pyrroline-5-carboxylate reductase